MFRILVIVNSRDIEVSHARVFPVWLSIHGVFFSFYA